MRRAHMRGHRGGRGPAGASSGAPFGRRVHTLSMSRASPALFLVCGSFETWFVHPEGHASRAGAVRKSVVPAGHEPTTRLGLCDGPAPPDASRPPTAMWSRPAIARSAMHRRCGADKRGRSGGVGCSFIDLRWIDLCTLKQGANRTQPMYVQRSTGYTRSPATPGYNVRTPDRDAREPPCGGSLLPVVLYLLTYCFLLSPPLFEAL